jgi:hypothetical protein
MLVVSPPGVLLINVDVGCYLICAEQGQALEGEGGRRCMSQASCMDLEQVRRGLNWSNCCKGWVLVWTTHSLDASTWCNVLSGTSCRIPAAMGPGRATFVLAFALRNPRVPLSPEQASSSPYFISHK